MSNFIQITPFTHVQDLEKALIFFISYAELKPKLDTLPTRDVYGPVNQPYGQRELLVLAPDGNLIVFGQAIETAKA